MSFGKISGKAGIVWALEKGKESLAESVYALAGSRAANVVEKMRELVAEKPELFAGTLLVVTNEGGLGKGLVLRDVTEGRAQHTYSTHHTQGVSAGQYVMQIGHLLPEHRVRQAACEILAMLRRGICTWAIGDPDKPEEARVCRSAYGPVRVVRPRRKADKKASRKSRREAESAGLHFSGLCA